MALQEAVLAHALQCHCLVLIQAKQLHAGLACRSTYMNHAALLLLLLHPAVSRFALSSRPCDAASAAAAAAAAAAVPMLLVACCHSPLQGRLRSFSTASCFEPIHSLPQEGHFSRIWYDGQCRRVVLQHHIAPGSKAASQGRIVAGTSLRTRGTLLKLLVCVCTCWGCQ
jgi:hypothetical protein